MCISYQCGSRKVLPGSRCSGSREGRKRQRVAASYVVASEKGCILRVKMVEFADGLDVEGERKRGDKDESWVPGLRNGVNFGIIS